MSRIYIVFLQVLVVLTGCTTKERKVEYSEIDNDKRLISTEYFSLEAQNCFQLQYDFQVGNERNLVGDIRCEDLSIHFEYGKLFYSTETDTSRYNYERAKESYRKILKISRGEYPREMEVYIEDLEPDNEEYDHIKRSLILKSKVVNKKDEQMIRQVFETVKFK